MLSEEQKNKARELIEFGDKLEAVRYLQHQLSITADQALKLAEKLEEDLNNEGIAESEKLDEKLNELKKEFGAKKQLNVGRLVGSIFMVVGSIMLAVAAYVTYANNQFSKRAIPVSGEVISYSSYESNDDDGGTTTMFTPTFSYTYNGKNYTHASNVSSSGQDYQIGEKVDVLVDPDDPTEVLIDSFWEKWLIVVILGFLGIMFAGMGYMVHVVLGKTN